MASIWNLEIAVTLFFQRLGTWLAAPMSTISLLGTQQFYMLVMPALYWCIDAAVGLRVGAILLISGAINTDLKLLFRGPRPFWVSSRVKAYSVETSFGIPSGHSQNSASVWGLMGLSARRRWAAAGAILLVFLIGLSRIYLGMHFSSDVLAGWLIGALILLAFVRLEKPVKDWYLKLVLSRQLLVILFSALAITFAEVAIHAAIAGYQLPQEWYANAIAATPGTPPDPLNLEEAFMLGGVWLGLLGGATWLNHYGGFDARGSLGQRAARYLIGLAGVAVFYYGLGKVLPGGMDLLGYSLSFVHSTLVGLWISAGAPAVFRRAGLAGKPVLQLSPSKSSLG
jgi:membrane-associated phospholipid phosphatase